MIFANNTVHWTEFVNMTQIRKIQKDAADAWLRNCLRYNAASKMASTTLKSPKSIDPSANVANLLNSYDAPIAAPDVPIEPVLIKKLPLTELKRTVFRTMQTDFRKLIELSRIFHMDVQELSSLDSMYKEMFRNLHENKMRKECREIRCSSIVSSNSCKGSLFITIDVNVQWNFESNDIRLFRKFSRLIVLKLVFDLIFTVAVPRNQRGHSKSAGQKSRSS